MNALDQVSEELARAMDREILSLMIAKAKLPEQYRLMDRGEFPNCKKGDLAYSITNDPRWTNTTMTGTYPIREVPAREPRSEGGLLWATKIG